MSDATTLAQSSDQLEQISALLSEHVVDVQPLTGGRNSRVILATTRSGTKAVAKFYLSVPGDTRDRFTTETRALEFMRQAGITCIPALLAADFGHRCIVLEYIDGIKSVDAITPADIAQLAEFVIDLARATSAPGATALPPASEAMFSLASLFENIEGRLLAISATGLSETDTQLQCAAFLNDELVPFYKMAQSTAFELYDSLEIGSDEDLSRRCRTLSPSDLGFHNAILRADGRWVFQDFEYFGWDDPAKLIIDLLLHPGMGLSTELVNVFLAKILPVFEESERELSRRTQALYPLFGVKWCIILLNEFLPAAAARRRFAGASSESQDGSNVLARQLEKSHKMLRTVRDRYQQLDKHYAL